MQIFHDCKQLKLATNRLIEIKQQRDIGQINLQDFYNEKKHLEATIKEYNHAKMPILNIHQAYTLKELLEFTFYEMQIIKYSECFINDLRLFTTDYVSMPQAETIYILDSYDYEDEENNPEGYTQYVIDNDLELAYNGELFVDVISSYQDYKAEFDVALLIKALEYYCKNDNFMEIE